MTTRADSLKDRVVKTLDDKPRIVLLVLIVIFWAMLGFVNGGGERKPGVVIEVDDVEGEVLTPRETSTPTGPPEQTPTPTKTPGGGGLSPGTTPTGSTPTPTPRPVDSSRTSNSNTTANSNTQGDGGAVTSSSQPRRAVDVHVVGRTATVSPGNVLPGDSGEVTLNATNVGSESGHLVVGEFDIRDYEGATPEPESDGAGGTTGGDMSSELLVRWSIVYADGEREYLFGSSDEYVTLESLDGEQAASLRQLQNGDQVTVTVEWKLPRSTGNGIQGDSAEATTDFALMRTIP